MPSRAWLCSGCAQRPRRRGIEPVVQPINPPLVTHYARQGVFLFSGLFGAAAALAALRCGLAGCGRLRTRGKAAFCDAAAARLGTGTLNARCRRWCHRGACFAAAFAGSLKQAEVASQALPEKGWPAQAVALCAPGKK